MRPTPLLEADSVTLILEAEADGKFVAESNSCDENRVFLRGECLTVVARMASCF
jgi:hypothetical protein